MTGDLTQPERGASPRPLLAVADLATTFHGARSLQAVRGVSFDLAPGRNLGIVGESGSGKSVLSRSVMNLLPKTAELGATTSVQLDGRELVGLPQRQWRKIWGDEIAMIFQNPMTSLNPLVRIGRQLTEPMRFHLGISKVDARVRAADLLQMVGISEPRRRMQAYPHELSGGMRQRVSIAIALTCSPRLLIADEPTTALDVTTQRQILDLLQSIQGETGFGLILITHDLGVVAGRTDEIAVMYAGRIVEHTTTKRLFSEPRHPYTEALLASMPRITNRSHTRLAAIAGRPPDMTAPPTGCAFAERCPYVGAQCVLEDPPLVERDGHRYACFHPVGSVPRADDLVVSSNGLHAESSRGRS